MILKTFDLIGKTPLLQLQRIGLENKGNIYCKAEFLQPGGSVKDRAALQIILDAYKSGVLKEGQPVVEMTSGNMGAGLAFVCREFRNPFIAVMPKGNSCERLKILKAFGAEIYLIDQVDGTKGMVTGNDIQFAYDAAKEISKREKGFFVDQFNNSNSVKAHFETTGPEILDDLPDIDVFVSIVGSGGSLIGVGKFLKSKNPTIKCVAVEPANAAILKAGKIVNARHIIQGTGYGIIPPHWQPELVDDIITVTDEEVLQMTKRLAREEGLYVGYSSGANIMTACKYMEQNHSELKIATILCDSGYKYSDL